MKYRGFTLVELLVVLGIFVTVGGVIVSLLYISLRGSNKSETVTTVKQNGTFALAQMVRQIRYAKSLDSPASCVPTANAPSIKISSLTDNGQTILTCVTGPGGGISSNSASLLDNNAVTVTNCSFTCSQQNELDPPRVTIQFTLSSKNSGSMIETQSSIPFQSSVIMRNAAQ